MMEVYQLGKVFLMIKYEVVSKDDTGETVLQTMEFEGVHPHSSHLRAIMFQLDNDGLTLCGLWVNSKLTGEFLPDVFKPFL